MNDLRDALERLAERGSPRPPAEVADEVVRRLGQEALVAASDRRPLLWAAAAAVLAVVVGAAVLATVDGEQPDIQVLTKSTTTSAPETTGTTGTTSERPTTTGTVALPSRSRWRPPEIMPVPEGGGWYHAVATDGSTFVAVGEAQDKENGGNAALVDGWVSWSSDGRVWERATGPFSAPGVQRMHDVVAVDGGFVAVGEWGADVMEGDAAVWRSDDGRTWERVGAGGEALGGAGFQLMQAVAARDGVVVAVGLEQHHAATNFDTVAWRSTDGGRTWQRVREPDWSDAASQQAIGVGAGPQGFVLVGMEHDVVSEPTNASAWYSDDGLTWERATVEGADDHTDMQAVTAGGPGWVAVGGHHQSAAAWTSVDGRAWERVPSSVVFGEPRINRQRAYLYTVLATPEGLVALGEHDPEGPTEWTSPDGRVWTRRDDGPRAETYSTPRGVAAAKGVVVAVGQREPNVPTIWVRPLVSQ